ncbi:PorV/PorQ family protein [Salinibacter sp.]|uniref:PorV/PorQ family protein n=1 Tax=Salinibacter sp. TaxID=2065818 RepID=UPI0021E82795|nr:PorV/PorQ family protein [Salinibacter sp.]
MRSWSLTSLIRRLGRHGGLSMLLGVGLMVGMSIPASGQDVGTGAFSRLGFGARGMALGNALVADPSADVSPHYNPALLPSASGQRVSASAALLSFDRELQFLEFTAPLGPTAGIGLSLTHAGVNDIDGRNADGARTETLSTDEFALSLAFGNRFADWLAVGTALTLYQSDLLPEVDPVRGFGVDLGVRVQPTGRLSLAATVKDLLAKYEWDAAPAGGGSHTDRFPVRVQVGGSYSLLDERLQFLAEVESRYTTRDRRDPQTLVTSGGPRAQTRTESFLLHDLRARVGAAYHPVQILRLRVGVDRLGVDDTNGLRPSAGFGVRQSIGDLDLRVSYAATLEPYVRTVMNTGTVELFL